MTKLGEAMVRSGALDAQAVNELRRWRLPADVQEDLPPVHTVEQAVELVREALESRDQVELRTTDLDMIRRYMDNRVRGRLVIISPRTDEQVGIDVWYYRAPGGEYVIPYVDDDEVGDRLTNGASYLKTKEGRLYFSDVQPLFFGANRYFISCRGTLETRTKGATDGHG